MSPEIKKDIVEIAEHIILISEKFECLLDKLTEFDKVPLIESLEAFVSPSLDMSALASALECEKCGPTFCSSCPKKQLDLFKGE